MGIDFLNMAGFISFCLRRLNRNFSLIDTPSACCGAVHFLGQMVELLHPKTTEVLQIDGLFVRRK